MPTLEGREEGEDEEVGDGDLAIFFSTIVYMYLCSHDNRLGDSIKNQLKQHLKVRKPKSLIGFQWNASNGNHDTKANHNNS